MNGLLRRRILIAPILALALFFNIVHFGYDVGDDEAGEAAAAARALVAVAAQQHPGAGQDGGPQPRAHYSAARTASTTSSTCSGVVCEDSGRARWRSAAASARGSEPSGANGAYSLSACSTG